MAVNTKFMLWILFVNSVFTASLKFTTRHSWESTILVKQNYDQPMQILKYVLDDKFDTLPEKRSEDETKADVWQAPSTNQKGRIKK